MIPKQLKNKNFRFIKLDGKHGEKSASEFEWNKGNNYNYEEIESMDLTKYGVICGYDNLVVIDFDDKEFQEQKIKDFPETFTVKTAGKGLYHLYYYCSEQPDNKKLKVCDVQGVGAYVVAAGTKLDNGKSYEVVKDIPISGINKYDLRELLKEVWDKTEKQDRKNIKSFEGVEQGKRDEICFRKCCSYLSKGIDKKDVYDIIITWNNKNQPPLADHEIMKCLNSALKYNHKNKKEINLVLPITNYQQNAEAFYQITPFFYDDSKIFWMWDEDDNIYKMVDDIEIRRKLDDCLGFKGQTITTQIKASYLEAVKWVGRDKKPPEAPLKWVQFKNKAYSLTSEKIYDVTPDYFFTNPIPWDLGKVIDTPKMDELITSWVGENQLKTVYEIIAYCCYRGYPIHRWFCFLGSGCNGKGTLMNLMQKFTGKNNFCSSELDHLATNNFATFDLYKKSVCFMGETNLNTMKSTTNIKMLTGGDPIRFEKKGKMGIIDYNYAKIIIASNSLPQTHDKTHGFYRRFLHLEFNNTFSGKKDVLGEIPEVEYNNLALKVCSILKELLEKREFHNELPIEQKKEFYEGFSNPLLIWLKEKTVKDVDGHIFQFELKDSFNAWCGENGHRPRTSKEINEYMREHYNESKRNYEEGNYDKSYRVWLGISRKKKITDFSSPSSPFSKEEEVNSIYKRTNLQTPRKLGKKEEVVIKTMDFDSNLIIYHKCEAEGCTEHETNKDSYNIHYCKKHWEELAQ